MVKNTKNEFDDEWESLEDRLNSSNFNNDINDYDRLSQNLDLESFSSRFWLSLVIILLLFVLLLIGLPVFLIDFLADMF